MDLTVIRYHSTDDYTLGMLIDSTNNEKNFLAYTLEDEHRGVKG